MRTKKTCKRCGATMDPREPRYQKLSESQWNSRRYCTWACKSKENHGAPAKPRKDSEPPEVKHCARCGEPMTRKSLSLSRGNWEVRIFCSVECRLGRKKQSAKVVGSRNGMTTTCATPGCDGLLTQFERDEKDPYCWRCSGSLERYLDLKRRTEGYRVPKEKWPKL